MQFIKSFIKNIYRHFRPIISHGNNNIIKINSQFKNFLITINGNENQIIISNNCRLNNAIISISGNNNKIFLDSNVKFDGPIKIIMSGNSILKVGKNSGIRGVTFVLKDADIIIGYDCMFSYGILLRNNDSHKVIDMSSNEILNKAENIIIEDHVWLCEKATILKGVKIGNNSIIAFGAVVTKSCPPNSIIAGIPAKVVKSNISWLKR